MTNRSKALAAGALLVLMAARPTTAAGVKSDDFTVYVSLASDYVLRGYSQTNEDPAVQLGLDFEHQSGLFAGLRLSNVDFPSVGPIEDSRDSEVTIYAGYGLELGRDWSSSAALNRYEYPGDQGSIDWSYTELMLALRFRTTALAATYSDSAFGLGSRGIAGELTDRWRLPADLELTAGVGFFDVDAPFLKDYFYWNLGLSRPLKRFTFNVGYFDTDDRGEFSWGRLAGARVVASMDVRIH